MSAYVFRVAILLVAATVLNACQTAPTRVRTKEPRGVPVREARGEPIKLQETTVVLDARRSFDYSLSHVPGSHNVQWDEFQQPGAPSRGTLQADRYAIARRLARLGITPQTSVVIVGKGPDGEGEEGRLGWMLEYLGVRDVRIADIDSLGTNLTNVVTEPAKNAAIWKPQLVANLLVNRDELRTAINRNLTAIKPGATQAQVAIIDVRTEREYLNKQGIGLRVPIPNMGAINIEWTEFFDRNGRPEESIVSRLRQVGIVPAQRIIVVSEQGVRSGAVTFALRRLGFDLAGNYAGGLAELVGEGSRPQ